MQQFVESKIEQWNERMIQKAKRCLLTQRGARRFARLPPAQRLQASRAALVDEDLIFREAGGYKGQAITRDETYWRAHFANLWRILNDAEFYRTWQDFMNENMTSWDDWTTVHDYGRVPVDYKAQQPSRDTVETQQEFVFGWQSSFLCKPIEQIVPENKAYCVDFHLLLPTQRLAVFEQLAKNHRPPVDPDGSSKRGGLTSCVTIRACGNGYPSTTYTYHSDTGLMYGSIEVGFAYRQTGYALTLNIGKPKMKAINSWGDSTESNWCN